MPFELNVGKAFILGPDGNYMPLGNLKDVTETLCAEPPENDDFKINLCDFNNIEMSFKVTQRFQERIKRIAYGWTSRGPVRKRLLHRLWGKYGIPIEVK